MIKKICLSVLLYVAVAILLFAGARNEWKGGNKTIATITFIVLLFTLWQGYENLKEIQREQK